ncbi:MAG: asparagine--tRNA ligase [Acidobacteria bacterium]|jgi:asparaginyl-tRNA synthetase|nr:MAG: asparagine--tRNA ligase [Acidobacteriales bacterium 13_2_20CM_2_55_5]OLD20504.1 MAG: asparagine--tRNA ligase [Acidobacteriales bacterium 13_1_40CM_3_55_5]PYV97594.1 MAG: asparagine--tRNA ligase [Acidobacteriota bacterium]
MSSPLTTIADIGKHEGQTVTLRGWLYNLRESGKLLFPIFRDGSGVIQGVLPKNAVSPEIFEAVKGLTQESSVIVEGKVRADKRAPGGYELDVSDVQVVQRVSENDPYPISLKEHGVDFLMEHRHLWVRTPRQAAILRVRAEIIKAARDFFDERGFTLTDPPILTPAACEGTTTLFPVDYFDEQAYLTQSGQLYIEATAMALGKVYSFGPTFRAEKSKTRRHLTEFWMVEPEIAYATLDDLMQLAEDFISFLVKRCLDRRASDLQIIGRDISKLAKIEAPFARITYDEAVKLLQEGHAKGALENNFEWGGDLGSPDETYISSQFDKPVMVHRYPAKIKAFYMEPDPDRPDLALCVDVLAPEGYGEIIGGSQRMASYDLLLKRIRQHGLPEEAFKWYLDLRKYGSVPHAGFGMGIERAVAWICGLEHVRETIPFPRMLHRLYP